MLSDKRAVIDLSKAGSIKRKAENIFASLIPSFDQYIKKYSIPTTKQEHETDSNFFTRVCKSMFDLNVKNGANRGWHDCWPSTAIKIGKTDCALGSLILARVLELANYERKEIEYGLPGPMTHAVLVTKGKYLDQANGVVVDVIRESDIDGIKTYQVVESLDKKVMGKVPFRRVPVCNIEQGVAPLIWNLSSLIRQNDQTTNLLINKFGLNPSTSYADWAKSNLLSESWDTKRMGQQPEWVKEKIEVDYRFSRNTKLII